VHRKSGLSASTQVCHMNTNKKGAQQSNSSLSALLAYGRWDDQRRSTSMPLTAGATSQALVKARKC
jgi:hypothetical protein